MTLKHAKGNLIDLAEQDVFDVIVHGCNCKHVMGSGIAKEIKTRYPEAFAIYTKHKPIIGGFSSVPTERGFIIVNAYTQYHYLPRGIDHFEYKAFEEILVKLRNLWPKKRFGFPYIGMGLAGGNKERIIDMLEHFAEELEPWGGSVTLVEFST